MHDQNCELRGNWRYVNRLIFNVLENISLANMGRDLTSHSNLEFPLHFCEQPHKRRDVIKESDNE